MTGVAGNDTVVVASANNNHGNTNLTIRTTTAPGGAENDTVTLAGPTAVTRGGRSCSSATTPSSRPARC